LLGGVELAGLGVFALALDHALGVAHQNVLGPHTQANHHVQAGNGGSAGTRHRHLHRANVFAHQLQAVEQRGAGDDGGAVLVVVEHGDVHALAQLLLDVEALGRLDVFQVDAAQGGFERGDDLDQFVGVALGQFDIKHIDACKLLEQTGLALHHRFRGQRADVAQAEHGRAVGDHAHEVAARGVFESQRWVGFDRQTRVGHAGRVGQREIALVAQGLGGREGNFSACGAAVVVQGGVAQGLFGGCHGCLLTCFESATSVHHKKSPHRRLLPLR
jgi:hypothetical protein